jgi:DNA modification methylase
MRGGDGGALVVQGDALHLPLPDESVDLVVTSPPYWALRAYGAGEAEIGSEPTPQAYLEALWAATAEIMRVLKPTGSAFVDLGDKYSGSQVNMPPHAGSAVAGRKLNTQLGQGQQRPVHLGPTKSLMLLPERYRIGCVDRLGLIARQVIVWRKPNSLPESVTDRCPRQHEDWVHLVNQPRYYSATDEVREPQMFTGGEDNPAKGRRSGNGVKHRTFTPQHDMFNPLGKLPGSVWSIPSEPLRLPDHLGVQHYAAFPSEWPRRLILGWSPPGICLECGHGRVPVVERGEPELRAWSAKGAQYSGSTENGGHHGEGSSTLKHAVPVAILGYACSCIPFTDHPGSGGSNRRPYSPDGKPNHAQGVYSNQAGEYERVGPWREYHLDRWTPPPTRPAVVLDPFCGTGTVPMVARVLGRIGVGVDLKADYCRAARWRVFSSGDWQQVIERTTGRRVKPLPKQHPGQVSLL